MKIWVNGGLVEAGDAAISVLDHGLTVGDGVFETIKSVDGVGFALTRHLRRLSRSAVGLGLQAPDLGEVRRACDAVLGANPMPLGRLRITYTGGISPLGSERGDSGTTLVVAVSEAKPRTQGTAVATVPWVRNENGALTGIKSTSYGENVRALALAKEQEASEALFANTRGQLCEGTGSNVFLVLDGQLVTPPLESGCLAGITRELVVEWCHATERELPLTALHEADEVFLTSSLRDVQAVSRVDERTLPAPGPVTRKAIETFEARAQADLDP